MFDISFMELLVIAMVALIVIGPERLPAVARTMGHLYGRCRNFMYRIRTDIHNEMRMEELRTMQSSVQETVQSIEHSVQQGVDRLQTTAAETGSVEPIAATPSQTLPDNSESLQSTTTNTESAPHNKEPG